VLSQWVVAERAFRREIRRRDFDKCHLKVLDFVLALSAARGERFGVFKAWVPRQEAFSDCLGIDPGDVSRSLKWLRVQCVLEVVARPQNKLPAAAWYGLLRPDGPPGWSVPLRAESNAGDWESWLEKVDGDHPELFPVPASLNDALREVFVEGSSVEVRAGLANEVEASRKRLGDALVGLGNPQNESPIGFSPISVDSSTRDRESISADREERSNSTSSITRSRGVCRDVSIEDRALAEKELFALIGAGERRGRCSLLWERAVKELDPDVLVELIAHTRDMQRTERLRGTPAAYLNRCVWRELEKKTA